MHLYLETLLQILHVNVQTELYIVTLEYSDKNIQCTVGGNIHIANSNNFTTLFHCFPTLFITVKYTLPKWFALGFEKYISYTLSREYRGEISIFTAVIH